MEHLVSLLDASADATRPAERWRVWEIAGRARVDRVLRAVLTVACHAGRRWILQADPLVRPDELGGGSWTSAVKGQWLLPFGLDADGFVDGELHRAGSYAIYDREEGALAEGLPVDLPWWGPASSRYARERWSGEALITGLRQLGVGAAVVVHADANALVIVVPGQV